MKKSLSIFLTTILLMSLFTSTLIVYAEPSNKCSKRLSTELSNLTFSETTDVVIITKNDPNISKKSKNSTSIFLQKNNEIQSIEEVQQQIQTNRIAAKKSYEKVNAELIEELKIDNVIYASKFAPVIFAKMTKKDIIQISYNSDIQNIYYCEKDVQLEENLSDSANTIRAKTIQSNSMFGYTGDGIKIGVLESKHPNTNFESINNADINLIPNTTSYMDSANGGHATTIATILASQGTSNTSKGIAPDSEYYFSAIEAYNTGNNSIYVAYIMALEDLIDSNVNIISISTGFTFPVPFQGEMLQTTVYNSYTTSINTDAYYITWLIDHYSNVENVSFSIAAGNAGWRGIPFPFLSYNGIVVGNIDDNNNSSITDDTLHFASSHYNEITPEFASKPDLCAPGTNISVNGTNKTYVFDSKTNEWVYKETTGTSFSAPHVAGAIALLCEQSPMLLYTPAAIKAVLTTGVSKNAHYYTPNDRVLTTDENNPANSYIQYGAGIINCLTNATIINNETFDFGYFFATTTNSSSYLDLSGNKNVRISLTFELNTASSNHNTNIDNFDIYLYDSSNNLLASSSTTYNNVEIIDAFIQTSGIYELRIVRPYSTNSDIGYGMAWTQY